MSYGIVFGSDIDSTCVRSEVLTSISPTICLRAVLVTLFDVSFSPPGAVSFSALVFLLYSLNFFSFVYLSDYNLFFSLMISEF